MVFLHINNDTKDKNETNKKISELKKHVSNGSHIFMLIYMEGCGPCNATRPEWKKLENVLKRYNSNNNVVIVDIDKDLLPLVKIDNLNPMGFPTIMHIKNKVFEDFEDSKIADEDKQRTVDSFVKWVDFKLSKDRLQKGGSQKGGIMIDTKDSEAFQHFIENSTFSYLSKGSFGITFKANLKPGVESKYKNIEIASSTDYGDPVTTLIIKFGFVHDASKGQKGSNVGIAKDLIFFTGELQTFKDEVNIQTDIFLKTINYLQPICPAIVYSNVYNDTNGINMLLETMVRGAENTITKQLLKRIYGLKQEKKFYNIGVIGMEFANSYTLLHSLKSDYFFNDYKNMTLYILLRLAIDTGYTHGDFHPGNIFINTTSSNYFEDVRGKPLLIDFGQAQKIPPDIMKFMKQQYNSGNYTEALKKLCDIDRPDEIVMKEYPTFYGFACGTYDYKRDESIRDFPPNTNREIGILISKREEAIDNMVELFKEKNAEAPEKYPLLPLSSAAKKSMYAGLIEGGRKRKNKTRKNRTRKWSIKYKRSINCNRPRGFSQKQHCKYGRK